MVTYWHLPTFKKRDNTTKNKLSTFKLFNELTIFWVIKLKTIFLSKVTGKTQNIEKNKSILSEFYRLAS